MIFFLRSNNVFWRLLCIAAAFLLFTFLERRWPFESDRSQRAFYNQVAIGPAAGRLFLVRQFRTRPRHARLPFDPCSRSLCRASGSEHTMTVSARAILDILQLATWNHELYKLIQIKK